MKWLRNIVLILLLIIFNSGCAKTIYYEPDGFVDIIDFIKENYGQVMKIKLSGTTPPSLDFKVTVSENLDYNTSQEIAKLIILYVQTLEFYNFFKDNPKVSIADDDNFEIGIYIYTYGFFSTKKSGFTEWKTREYENHTSTVVDEFTVTIE